MIVTLEELDSISNAIQSSQYDETLILLDDALEKFAVIDSAKLANHDYQMYKRLLESAILVHKQLGHLKKAKSYQRKMSLLTQGEIVYSALTPNQERVARFRAVLEACKKERFIAQQTLRLLNSRQVVQQNSLYKKIMTSSPQQATGYPSCDAQL